MFPGYCIVYTDHDLLAYFIYEPKINILLVNVKQNLRNLNFIYYMTVLYLAV